MVGRRGRNLREGDLAEGIGLELIRAFALVAPVPRTEDVGIDAVGTLVRPGHPHLVAERSFLIQVKSASVPWLDYVGPSYHWLMELKLPLFVAKVRLSEALVELYTTHRAVDPLDGKLKGVRMYLSKINAFGEDYDHAPDVRKGVHHVSLGDPVLRWTAANAATNVFRQKAYEILHRVIEIEESNLSLRGYKQWNALRWKTNEAAKLGGQRFGAELDASMMMDFANRLGAFAQAVAPRCTTTRAEILLRAISVCRLLGSDSMALLVGEAALKAARSGRWGARPKKRAPTSAN